MAVSAKKIKKAGKADLRDDPFNFAFRSLPAVEKVHSSILPVK
jgi:hypothetical protein